MGNDEIDEPITGTITATDPDNRIGTSSTFAIAEGSSPTSTGGAAAITKNSVSEYAPKMKQDQTRLLYRSPTQLEAN